MAQNTRRISDDAQGTEEHICQCGHDKYRRQSSSHSSTRVFAGVSSPPAMRSDSSESQESDVQGDSGGDARRQIIQLQQELKDAVQKLKEVTKMNSRWQKYDKEREVIVVNLTSQSKQAEGKVRELTEKIRRLETKLADQRNRSEELELRWTDARVRAAERKSEVERVQREREAVKVTLKQSEKKRQEMAKKLEAAMKQGGGCREREEEEDERRRDADKDRDLYHMSKRVVDLKERVDILEKQAASHKTEIDQQADLYTQQITRYQDQQKPRAPRYVKPATQHVQKYYANMYDENLGSWDDADYALPSDVVRDQAEVVTPAGRRRPQTASLVDLPPHYDDRSILGHVITSPPKTYQIGTIAAAQTQRVEELVCH
ncbi:trichohyalin isoform X2 [Strongylocentrotus purpuratus]|uniref:Uncharacterized protein n=1 Tax=Strongylocentrotus purpuratus TaxID=7668 RepID=A0A7M7NUK0_STRPU|nr:trichohyalin isoform X2 [Strongylocentrotus purpuratus]